MTEITILDWRRVMSELISFEDVEARILTIQGEQVLIDRDVAELYGIETKDVNRAVKNNPDKFPAEYIITLSNEEKSDVVKNFHHLRVLKFSHALPTAFTEKGLYMLATILKSPMATQTTLAIVETFAKIREFAKIITQLPDVSDGVQQKSLVQRGGEIFTEVLDDCLLEVTGDEITYEVDLGVVKVKRTVKRKKKK